MIVKSITVSVGIQSVLVRWFLLAKSSILGKFTSTSSRWLAASTVCCSTIFCFVPATSLWRLARVVATSTSSGVQVCLRLLVIRSVFKLCFLKFLLLLMCGRPLTRRIILLNDIILLMLWQVTQLVRITVRLVSFVNFESFGVPHRINCVI